MTVTWKLSDDDIKKAIREWLQNNHGVNTEGAEIIVNSYQGVSEALVKGVVETLATGPYR